ncbi:GcrA cell cycle regulator [Breoghania corrubedonensis]|uniref:GcrA cell cycle regulator n=1 Tax=Breoghania corrubedonensis TaxID=665038 RepID=A0A2T5VEJ7_9HYPH|nr:GcrA family cell cycle regulator [Breoghania corrubedonensis]PTW62146.1 GcrA cell cycle regulator [Breoghania corrubedonensis]
MSWTTERVDLLKKLWSEGLSASQIATELGGVTRNAVIGKVHRLGLSGRAKTATAPAKPRRTRPATSAPARPAASAAPRTIGATALKAEPTPVAAVATQPAPVAELVIPQEQRATILQLNERTCKWPIGDPSTDDFYFCGRNSDPGVPYCAHHCRIAYQPMNDRRRDKRARG